MAIEVKVPDLPESVAEGVLLSWHKSAGDAVSRDDHLVDIETDKVVLEIPSPDSGILKTLIKNDGDTVTSGEVLAILEAGAVQTPSDSPAPANESVAAEQQEPALSPAVRQLLAEHQINPAGIEGSGKQGRIIKQDVLKHIADKSRAAPAPASAPPATGMLNDEGRRQERVPMTRLRARIAERLVQSQQTAAILTTFNEVNMKPVMDLRARYRDRFEKEHGIKLGFMSFFVRACTEALKKFPVINASIDDEDIIYHGYYDIGIAVGSPRGLVVPVLRNADSLSFPGIESGIRDFGVRARDGKLGLEELVGGTFSITNGGIFGSMLSTPIINPPQSAILGMHNIVERPVVENGEIVVRPVMYLALSYDHRIIDGREAVSFLVAIKQSLEDPASILLAL